MKNLKPSQVAYMILGFVSLLGIIYVGWWGAVPKVAVQRNVSEASSNRCTVNGGQNTITIYVGDTVTYRAYLTDPWKNPLYYLWTVPNEAEVLRGCGNTSYCGVQYKSRGFFRAGVGLKSNPVIGVGCPYVQVNGRGSQVNMRPSVNAGKDQTVTIAQNPISVTLSGTGGDDNLPNPPGKLTYSWSQISGPSATLGSQAEAIPDQPTITVTINSVGTHTFHLTASDGELSAIDDVSVYVANSTTNHPPTVSAGPNQTKRVATQGPTLITLSGSASDDGLPIPPNHLTYSWTQISGPSGVKYVTDAYALSTRVSLSTTGVYKFRLIANDSQLHSSSDVTIDVQPNVNLTIAALDVIDANGQAVSSLVPGQPYKIQAVVANNGSQAITQMTSLRFCTNVSLTNCIIAPYDIDPNASNFVFQTNIGGFLAGEARTFTTGAYTFTPQAGDGSSFVAACVDPGGAIDEFNETLTDNCRGKFLWVQ